MDKKRLGQALRAARTHAGLDIDEVARQVPGLSAGVLGKYERGERKFAPDTDVINGLAEVLKVPVLDLVLAMGYRVSITGLDADEWRLVEAYRLLTPRDRRVVWQQVLGLRVIEAEEGEAVPSAR